jgi:signal transduction histidine kinase
MNFQWFQQLASLSAELRTASRDLFQTSNEVSQLRERNEELLNDFQSASTYKSDFMTNMSHKLRTPLNSIAGYTELLQSGIYGELNEKQTDRMSKIARNGQMLLELINDMLDLSRLESGRMELQRIMFRPVDMIDHVIREAEPVSKAKGLILETVIAPDVQPLYADEKRITQVINQLVQNAIKFTVEGSVSVELQNVHVADGRTEDFKLPTIGWLTDGPWVLITVRDTGIGITPESQAKIFDEFFQVNETGGEFNGTGLGLAICKRLVQLHDGVIWVNSTSGVGSVFYVALPAQRENVRGRQNRTAA